MSGIPIYVCSPGLDQARYIAAIIAGRHPGCAIVGVTMPDEAPAVIRAPFTRTMSWTDLSDETKTRCIPTGAHSTAARLERGDVALGAALMNSDALRFYSKQWSITTAADAGVPVPKTWYTCASIEAFPIFYKSMREGDGKRGLIHSATELPDLPEGALVYQEFIDSPGTYGVAFIAEDGHLRASHCHFEATSYPETGGSAVIIERFDDARLRRHAERLLQATRFSGWGLVEFKYCPKRNDYVFMELNAKLWASSELAFRNEPLFPAILLNAPPSGPPLARLVFLHRAFARGGRFVLAHFGQLLAGPIRSTFGQSIKPFIRAFTPQWVMRFIRAGKNR